MSDFLRPLFSRLQGGAVNHRATSANSHIDPRNGLPFNGVFAGVFMLNNPLGCFWQPLNQSGALVLSESAYSEVGGCDNVRIVADGNTITVPGAWVNMGTDSISTSAAAINDITVIKKTDRIEYIVKVL